MINKLLSIIRLPLFVLGAVGFFTAERYLAQETYHPYLRGASLALMVLGIICTLLLSLCAKRTNLPAESRSWFYTVSWQVVFFLGFICYIIYARLLGTAASPETFLTKALLVLYVLLIIFGIAAAIGLEWALKENGRGPLAEPFRVSMAGLTYLSMGVLLAFFITINYVGSKKDYSYDLSYFKTTKPSESTFNMAKTLTDPMKVILFYPKNNEIYEYVNEYFKALSAKEKKIEITTYDTDFNPTTAENYRVSKNGEIVIEVKDKKERISTGLTASSARAKLKKFDAEFQKAFLSLTAARKTVYFTTGHGESSWTTSSSRNNPLKSIELLETFLQRQNYAVRHLSLGEGSAKEIPHEASVVAIIGPDKPFLKEEVEALKTYLENGGKLLVMLDVVTPDENLSNLDKIDTTQSGPLVDYLKEIGLEFFKIPLANDKNYVSATRSPADHWFLFSNVFTSHESVTSIAKHEERIAVLMFQAGYFAVTPQLGNWKHFETVKSLSDTFADLNRNFSYDSATEKRRTYTLGVVSTYKNPATKPPEKKEKDNKDTEEQTEGRIVAFADATVASDALIRNPGNLLYLADSFKWLVGEVASAGNLTSEEDIKIQHTRNEDLKWFYGSVAGVPVLLLMTGFFATRTRRKFK